MKIIDFLEIEDRFLIEVNNWMNTIKAMYDFIMTTAYNSNYKGRYNYKTVTDKITLPNVSSTVKLLERFSFRINASSSNYNTLLKLRKEIIHNKFSGNMKYFDKVLFRLRLPFFINMII